MHRRVRPKSVEIGLLSAVREDRAPLSTLPIERPMGPNGSTSALEKFGADKLLLRKRSEVADMPAPDDPRRQDPALVR